MFDKSIEDFDAALMISFSCGMMLQFTFEAILRNNALISAVVSAMTVVLFVMALLLRQKIVKEVKKKDGKNQT